MNVSVKSILITGGLFLMVGGCGHYSMNKDNTMTKGNHVTTGSIMTTSAGAERNYTITGDASMVRTPQNKTMVSLHVAGLHADQKYPSHIHNLPCEEKGGGAHYQHEKGGNVDAANEIWLTFTTNNSGSGSQEASHAHLARPDAQSIVIHDNTSDKARIACLNLN